MLVAECCHGPSCVGCLVVAPLPVDALARSLLCQDTLLLQVFLFQMLLLLLLNLYPSDDIFKA